MKKLKFNENEKADMIRRFTEELENYGKDGYKDMFTFSQSMVQKPAQKVTVFFTPTAFIKSQALVRAFTGEVGWHGLMDKIDDYTYLVYDILVYPQVVNGARTLDPTKTNEWYEQHEEDLDKMHFQAHSHVNMTTTPSTTDIANQKNVVCNSDGFKLFQIWNKSGDINSFLYDIDNNIMYDRNDIIVEITDQQFGTMTEFVKQSKELVEDMPLKPVTQTVPAYNAHPRYENEQKKAEPPLKLVEKQEEKNGKSFEKWTEEEEDNYYWKNYGG